MAMSTEEIGTQRKRKWREWMNLGLKGKFAIVVG